MSPETAPNTKGYDLGARYTWDMHGLGTSARLTHSDLSLLVESIFSLFLSTTSLTTEPNSSRSARATPVLVIRPAAQPPLDEKDWEPPSALGVCSPEGFKSEPSISQLRPYTPSPSVSAFAPSSATSSTAATPTADPSARPGVGQVLEQASEALFLHAQQSSVSVTSESAYSDTDTAPETFAPVEPDDDKPEPEKIPEIDLEPKSPELPPEQILSDSAVESLQVERPLSPVAVGLAASSASTVSRDRKKPTIRPSLLGFFSRWADKRPPSGKDQKDKQAGPISSSQGLGVPHDPPPNGGSAFTRLRNKSTDKLSALLGVGEEIKPSSSSIRSSRFKLGSRRTNSESLRTTEKTDSGSAQPPSQTAAQISPPASLIPEAETVPAADPGIPAEGSSVRSSERGQAIESRSSAESPNKPPARSPSEEPIGGEPVLISTDLQSDPELNTVLPESVQHSAENASRDLPTPPRSRSPSLFRKKLRDKRARTGSLRDLLKKSDSTKSKKQERFTPPTPFIAWITQHTHRSPSEPPLPAPPTPLATPHLSLPPENLSPVVETPTDTSRILSLVWYPPELIRSPYASDISLSEHRANNPNSVAAPFDERDSSISARLSGLPEPADEPDSQPNLPFYLQPPFPETPSHIASASTSTVHAQPISERRSPAKLRRKHRPGNKINVPRTPPTSYSALSRKHSRGRHESTESVAGSIGPASTAPSRSLDTLLNSSWPEPPVNQPVKSDGEEDHAYNYLTETGAEDDSDQEEEYLPSPTSIGGASTRPTTPKHLRARSRSRSSGDAIRDEHPLPAVIHGAPDDQSDWDPDSRVTSFLSASPSTARTPASAVKAPPVPPLPQHISPRAKQSTGGPSATRPIGIFDSLPFRSPSPDGRPVTIASAPPPRSLSATPPARPLARTASPSPTGASSTPRAPSPVPPPRVPSGTPILRSPALPRRTTSYQSAASIHQSSERRDSVEEDHFALDDGRSAAIPNFPKRRSPTQGRKDLNSTSRGDSGHYRRSRKDSGRSHRESIKSHRDSIALRKDLLQAQRRDSIHSLERRDSIDSQNKDQVTSDNQIWTVPRNHRQRPTITFEFPPTNEFWHFLNEYQQYINPGSTRGENNEHVPTGTDMADLRSGSAASGSSKSSRSQVDPVKDWHKVQPTSSRASSSRASIDRTGTPYVPTPEVIERNELIVKALKNAPGALHTRFRHFGQLGVLGWSSEFSELIDEIQRCGLERQMFTTTRAQALSTCKALLRLHIDIRLQMISMFLCSQIARLRRFLDAETEYTDYPTPDFPLPEAY